MSQPCEIEHLEVPGLQRCLDNEAMLITSLVAALRREQDLLASGDPSDLPQLLEQKDALCRELNRSTRERVHAQLEHGLPAAPLPHLLELLDHHAAASSLAHAFHRLRKLGQEAADLNRLNGQLLHEFRTANQHALSVLNAGLGEPSTYGPRGLSCVHPAFTGSRGRSFGVA